MMLKNKVTNQENVNTQQPQHELTRSAIKSAVLPKRSFVVFGEKQFPLNHN